VVRKIEYAWYDFKNGIKNLIMWFPIVWRDRNWDHTYIYRILRHKLYLTEMLIRNHGIHVRNIKDANKIKLCVNLLDRLINDDYHEGAFKRHYEKWGHGKFLWDDADLEGYKTLKIEYPNVKTSKDEIQEKKDFSRSSKHEIMLREQDLDYLFKQMRKHIQTWWN